MISIHAPIVWVILLPCTLGLGPSYSTLTMVKYAQRRVCDNNTFIIENGQNLPSCALWCRGNGNCTTFGYRDNGNSENCLLMGSVRTNKHPASYTGYQYYPMEMDSSSYKTDTTGSWMLIQRRTNGEIDFYRNWIEYKIGFGDHCEFWLGNNKLHELTKDGEYRLRIELEDNDGVMAAAEWDTFIVGDEQSNYQLTVGGFNGADPPGDSMTYHSGEEFSTTDVDNDAWDGGSCASQYDGGWWFKKCLNANLNGEYGDLDFAKGINWLAWRGHSYSLSGSKMMIKRN